MLNDNHYIDLGRLKPMNEVDKSLDKIVREVDRQERIQKFKTGFKNMMKNFYRVYIVNDPYFFYDDKE